MQPGVIPPLAILYGKSNWSHTIPSSEALSEVFECCCRLCTRWRTGVRYYAVYLFD